MRCYIKMLKLADGAIIKVNVYYLKCYVMVAAGCCKMDERYKHKYVNSEVSEIIDTYENESLTAEEITDRLDYLDQQQKHTKLVLMGDEIFSVDSMLGDYFVKCGDEIIFWGTSGNCERACDFLNRLNEEKNHFKKHNIDLSLTIMRWHTIIVDAIDQEKTEMGSRVLMNLAENLGITIDGD